MGRQVLEDIISFFYLSEPSLPPDQKEFRELVWRYHGATEHVESARLARITDLDSSPKGEQREELKQRLENHPMFVAIEKGNWKDRIGPGHEGHILHDNEILQRRGIRIGSYRLPHKVLSNFAHFSSFSHEMFMSTSADWQKSWVSFLQPTLAVAQFSAEVLEAFLETFPQIQTRQLLAAHELAVVANWRAPLKATNQRAPEEPVPPDGAGAR